MKMRRIILVVLILSLLFVAVGGVSGLSTSPDPIYLMLEKDQQLWLLCPSIDGYKHVQYGAQSGLVYCGPR